MPWIYVLVLAIVQGLAELLPVSSSAHVIVVAHFLGVNMSTPANALLLVLLHTGTMLAVIAYFWRRWRRTFLASWARVGKIVPLIFVSSLFSGLVFLPVERLVRQALSHGAYRPDIEVLFHKLSWIAPPLAIVGLLILYAGLRQARRPNPAGTPEGAPPPAPPPSGAEPPPAGPAAAHGPLLATAAVAAIPTADGSVGWGTAIKMGVLQGFAIPFRGFSRSGATISGGLLQGEERQTVEAYSFAMVVAITPLAVLWELRRVVHSAHAAGMAVHWAAVLPQGLLGMVFAFLAGLLALKWLSRWLEQGRWHWFGIYCLVFAAFVEAIYRIH
ncbi:MAG: undecaprenyl-diphosphate phosphatase [Terriglobales bacterium]